MSLSAIDTYLIDNVSYLKEYKNRSTRSELKCPDNIDEREWKHCLKVGSTGKKHLLEVYCWKYGSKVGQQKFSKYKSLQQGLGTLTYYVNKFGEKEGSIRYKAKCANVSVGYERLVNKFGKKKALEIKARHSTNSKVDLNSFIKRYGEKEGKERYQDLCKKQRSSSVRTLGYWKKKGFSDEEARERLSQHQSRGKAFYIKKYGKLAGTRKWKRYRKARSSSLEANIKRHGLEKGTQKHTQWRKAQKGKCTLKFYVHRYGFTSGVSKYREVNKGKSLTLDKLINKHGVRKGTRLYRQILSKKIVTSSAGERALAQLVEKYVAKYSPESIVRKSSENPYQFFLPAFVRKELSNKHVIVPDIVILDLKLIFEYNGDVFHAHPKKFADDSRPNPFSNKTALEIRQEEKVRKNFLRSKGYRVITVWESFAKENPNLLQQRVKRVVYETCKSTRKN